MYRVSNDVVVVIQCSSVVTAAAAAAATAWPLRTSLITSRVFSTVRAL